MSNKIKTAKELKEKYGIGKIKKQAQKVYDENYHLLENFMKKNNLDKYWYNLSQSVFFICIGNDGRVEIEKNIKNYLVDKNRKWIKRINYLLEDKDFCECLVIPIEDLNEMKSHFQREIDFFTKNKKPGQVRLLRWALGSFILQMKYEDENHKKIIDLIHSLFIELKAKEYGSTHPGANEREKIRKSFVDPVLKGDKEGKQYFGLHGFHPYYASKAGKDSKRRQLYMSDRRMEMIRYRDFLVRVTPK
jgi:hypothetical protein